MRKNIKLLSAGILTFGFILSASSASFALGNDAPQAESDSLKTRIYSKFKNPHCNMPLETCNCPVGREMKGYIDGLLEAGMKEGAINYRIAKRFTLASVSDANLKSEMEKRFAADTGGRYPQIAIEPAAFDFGEVDKKQGRINKTFKIFNKGNEDLVISNIKVSCVCVSASLITGADKSPYFDTKGAPQGWKARIKPNEGAELEIILDLGHKSVSEGDLFREISIISNDPFYPEINIKIEAKVKAPAAREGSGNSQFSGRLENGSRVVELKAYKYKFEPDPIVVKKGEKIRLVAKSADVAHGISIHEFNVNTVIPADKEAIIEFTADKAGEFTVYCSVYCGSGHGKMQARFIVRDGS